MSGFITIIGGIYRGKKIFFNEADTLRPTPARVKETLFNWLMHDIRGLACLDAFAGSGGLGFEALSRGAKTVTFIEQSTKTCKILEAQAKSLKNCPPYHVVCLNTLIYLEKCKERYDLIFLDPPFYSDLLHESIARIEENNLLKTGGLLYIESPEIIHLPSHTWLLKRQKKASSVHYALYERLDKNQTSCFNHSVFP